MGNPVHTIQDTIRAIIFALCSQLTIILKEGTHQAMFRLEGSRGVRGKGEGLRERERERSNIGESLCTKYSLELQITKRNALFNFRAT